MLTSIINPLAARMYRVFLMPKGVPSEGGWATGITTPVTCLAGDIIRLENRQTSTDHYLQVNEYANFGTEYPVPTNDGTTTQIWSQANATYYGELFTIQPLPSHIGKITKVVLYCVHRGSAAITGAVAPCFKIDSGGTTICAAVLNVTASWQTTAGWIITSLAAWTPAMINSLRIGGVCKGTILAVAGFTQFYLEVRGEPQ